MCSSLFGLSSVSWIFFSPLSSLFFFLSFKNSASCENDLPKTVGHFRRRRLGAITLRSRCCRNMPAELQLPSRCQLLPHLGANYSPYTCLTRFMRENSTVCVIHDGIMMYHTGIIVACIDRDTLWSHSCTIELQSALQCQTPLVDPQAQRTQKGTMLEALERILGERRRCRKKRKTLLSSIGMMPLFIK